MKYPDPGVHYLQKRKEHRLWQRMSGDEREESEVQMWLREIGVTSIIHEDGLKRIDLRFAIEDRIVGEGEMTWSFQVDSLAYNKAENRFTGLARRRASAKTDEPFTDFSVEIQNKGIHIVDKIGARLFVFKDETAGKFFSHFLWSRLDAALHNH